MRPLLFLGMLLAAAGASLASEPPPTSYGLLLFPAFQALDVFGPLDALNLLSFTHNLSLSLFASSLSPVSTAPLAAAMNPHNSTFAERVLPTHTFAQPPTSLDVLIVPGGPGTRAADLQGEIEFIACTYPKLRYLISVCTGAGLVARAGVLDGKYATTNKKAWNTTTAWGPRVKWVPRARWVVDGNVWSSSGVSAGIDVTLAFMREMYGEGVAADVAVGMEYVRNGNASGDAFAELYGL